MFAHLFTNVNNLKKILPNQQDASLCHDRKLKDYLWLANASSSTALIGVYHVSVIISLLLTIAVWNVPAFVAKLQ